MARKVVLVVLAIMGVSLSGGCAVISRSSQPAAPVEAAQGDPFSDSVPATSDDGRYVAFTSGAANLVRDDTNGTLDVFVRDRVGGTTERVSVGGGGAQALDGSSDPSISGDGRFVAFTSYASNLVAADGNGATDVFVRDRLLGATARVSLDSFGDEANAQSFAPAISGDGRYVAFGSLATDLDVGDTNSQPDVFVRDRQTNTTTRANLTVTGTQSSGLTPGERPAISDDGRYVAFMSEAADLLGPGVDTNGTRDVFMRDRVALSTTRASVGVGGVQGDSGSEQPAISSDGRYVAFRSGATNLLGPQGDTNGFNDIYVRDRQAGTTERVSVATGGVQATSASLEPSISDNGRHVAFASDAPLVAGDSNGVRDVFVRDRTAATTTRVSVRSGGLQATGGTSNRPALSGDGAAVAFVSTKPNLVVDDTNAVDDTFAHVVATSKTERVSVGSNHANGDSAGASTSDDGRLVAFSSSATNLAPRDTNAQNDVFVKDHLTGVIERVSVTSSGAGANGHSNTAAISGDGRYVAFVSAASNLVVGDMNGVDDVFVHDRLTGATERVSVSSNELEGNQASAAPAISDDGRYVVFESDASNLIQFDDNASVSDVFRRDRVGGETIVVSLGSNQAQGSGDSAEPAVSGDGRYVAFASLSTLVPGDTNLVQDVYRRDVVVATTIRSSVDSGGTQANALSYDPAISDDGVRVLFTSNASNLVIGDTNGGSDVFLRSTSTCNPIPCFPSTGRVSVATGGAEGNGGSGAASVSDDARFVAFTSMATNLVLGDTNAKRDIFVRDRATGRTSRVSTSLFLDQGNNHSDSASMSGDGRAVGFASLASNLVDGVGGRDIFLRAQPVPTVTNVSPNAHADGGAAFGTTITGTNFLVGAQIKFAVAGITATVNTVNDTTITATFTIPLGTPSGSIDVYVANPGTGPGPLFGAMGRCTGCFTVT